MKSYSSLRSSSSMLTLPSACVNVSSGAVLKSFRKPSKAALAHGVREVLFQGCGYARPLTQLRLVVDRRLVPEERHCCGLREGHAPVLCRFTEKKSKMVVGRLSQSGRTVLSHCLEAAQDRRSQEVGWLGLAQGLFRDETRRGRASTRPCLIESSGHGGGFRGSSTGAAGQLHNLGTCQRIGELEESTNLDELAIRRTLLLLPRQWRRARTRSPLLPRSRWSISRSASSISRHPWSRCCPTLIQCVASLSGPVFYRIRANESPSLSRMSWSSSVTAPLPRPARPRRQLPGRRPDLYT